MTLGSVGMPTEQAAAVCLDVGSTWTKAVLVRPDGTLAGFAEHPTTAADVLTGMDAAVRAVAAAAPVGAGRRARAAGLLVGRWRAAAGRGRLRALTSTEAGHRVACSSGAHVVHVHAGPLEPADVRLLRSARPGVVLLFGGADGDDPAGLLHNAGRLARARIRYPVLLAGNAEARADAEALLRATGRTVLACDNVHAAAGRGGARPGPGGAGRSCTSGTCSAGAGRRSRPGSAGWCGRRRRTRWRGPRCELARICGRPVLVVDVGSATTDVHSVGRPGRPGAPSRATSGCARPPAACWWRARPRAWSTRWRPTCSGPPCARLTTEVGYLPKDPGSAAEDRRIAALAALIAARRHLRAHPEAGHDLGLVVLTGGVFRQRDTAGGLGAVVSTLRSDPVLAPRAGRRADAGRRRLRGPAGRPARRARPDRPRPRRCCATTCSADRRRQ